MKVNLETYFKYDFSEDLIIFKKNYFFTCHLFVEPIEGYKGYLVLKENQYTWGVESRFPQLKGRFACRMSGTNRKESRNLIYIDEDNTEPYDISKILTEDKILNTTDIVFKYQKVVGLGYCLLAVYGLEAI